MVLLLAKKKPHTENYFWGCSNYPLCRNLESTLLKKVDPWFGQYTINSIKFINSTDRLTDEVRHCAISEKFSYDHKFSNSDIENLDILLGFENKNDFFFWICTQSVFFQYGKFLHNYFGVGSPYSSTFKKLNNFINKEFDNVLLELLTTKSDLIFESNKDWRTVFDLENRKYEERIQKYKENQRKEEKERLHAIKKKSIKATVNMFNAIRRKDYKAILALRLKGADLQYKNNSGLNPLEYADSFKDKLLIEALTCEIEE